MMITRQGSHLARDVQPLAAAPERSTLECSRLPYLTSAYMKKCLQAGCLVHIPALHNAIECPTHRPTGHQTPKDRLHEKMQG